MTISLPVGCGAEGDSGGDGDLGPDGDNGGDADADADSDADADGDGLPPEEEDAADFRRPQSGRRYVYVANTVRDTVAVIDSRTLSIEIVDVGDAPFVLGAVPGREAALVLHETLPEVGLLETTDAGTTVTRLEVQPGANRIEVAPDGRHAVVFFDPDRATDPNASEGSYQDLTVVRIDERPAAIRLTVGFHPTEVQFADEGRIAFVVTEDALHRIVLDDVHAPGIAPSLDIGPSPPDPSLREVVVTPDGAYALVRVEGSADVLVLDVAARRATTVTLPAAPTDLDVSPDGTDAIAVLRDTAEVVLLPLPGIVADPATFRTITLAGELFGQAVRAEDGDLLVLFTTAVPQERLVVLDLATEEWMPVPLRKTVRTVGVAPGGRTAIVIHDKLEGDPTLYDDLEERIDHQYGYSMVDLAGGFVRLQITAVNAEPMLLYEDGLHAFLALRDDRLGVRELEAVDLAAFQVRTLPLPSPPSALGAVPDTEQAYVAQDHKSGRITFIGVESLETQTVTGFELGAEVIQ